MMSKAYKDLTEINKIASYITYNKKKLANSKV